MLCDLALHYCICPVPILNTTVAKSVTNGPRSLQNHGFRRGTSPASVQPRCAMRIVTTLLVLTITVPLYAKLPVVQRGATWVEMVQRGDMPASLQAQGTLSDSRTAALSLNQ